MELPAIVQMLKQCAAETFKQYAQDVILPYIFGQLQHASQLDLVWDSYKADSLKAAAWAKHSWSRKKLSIYLAAHQIAASLSTEKSLALPMFHALTGAIPCQDFWDLARKLLEIHSQNLLQYCYSWHMDLLRFQINACMSLKGFSFLFMTEPVLVLTLTKPGRSYFQGYLASKEFHQPTLLWSSM